MQSDQTFANIQGGRSEPAFFLCFIFDFGALWCEPDAASDTASDQPEVAVHHGFRQEVCRRFRSFVRQL
jgi:hypothetical protein